MATRITRTNIHNTQSWCERLASADVGRCTATKSERTISASHGTVPGTAFIQNWEFIAKITVYRVKNRVYCKTQFFKSNT